MQARRAVQSPQQFVFVLLVLWCSSCTPLIDGGCSQGAGLSRLCHTMRAMTALLFVRRLTGCAAGLGFVGGTCYIAACQWDKLAGLLTWELIKRDLSIVRYILSIQAVFFG
jgi:hypothetical protein